MLDLVTFYPSLIIIMMLDLFGAGAGSEKGEEDREEEEPVEEAQHYHQEDHLEEGQEDVGGRDHQT